MKRVAIMQPYFFPYIGYYALIRHVDEFILLDAVQFIRHGWVDRNRILKQGGGFHYIRPALQKKSHTDAIQEVLVDNTQNWQSRMISQLDVYRRRAPNFHKVRALVGDILSVKYERLADLNQATLRGVFEYLDQPFNCELFSSSDLRIAPPATPGEWALNVCRAIGDVEEYWNPINGRDLFDEQKYREAGINLGLFEYKARSYAQGEEAFESSLSIIDVLMFNHPEVVVDMLNDFSVHPAGVIDQ
ncbi:WbqC family protein [Tianweitania sp. BSSL-BM11]|uniref:WbqC family protein n=1 Tax=Tianweitania aestuarii TaxID=2814886 RepID=A0ABS5RX27_9HYPH|nr:WbqC family protein [Tianweitania aestuarii]MBS9720764.1 WbqC family protein [Tianweitania aestuarii]